MNGWSSVSSSNVLRRARGNFRNGITVMGALSLVMALVLAGCGPQGMSTTTEGTLGGGVLGGGTGAIVGAAVGHSLGRAAIGGVAAARATGEESRAAALTLTETSAPRQV